MTIPISLRKAINTHEKDTLQARIENEKLSIMSMVGTNQGSGLYDSAKDIDNTILDMREQWR